MIKFACFCPHAPILIDEDDLSFKNEEIKETVSGIVKLRGCFEEENYDLVLVSSPHPEWGVEIPLRALYKDSGNIGQIFNYQEASKVEIEERGVYPILTSSGSIEDHFEWGRKLYRKIDKKWKVAYIASGDMSHTLKEDGPYGYDEVGVEFDERFLRYLKEKNIEGILSFDNRFLLKAGVCGIWSFGMCLGFLEETGINYQVEILSYQAPFGVGYLVCNFILDEERR